MRNSVSPLSRTPRYDIHRTTQHLVDPISIFEFEVPQDECMKKNAPQGKLIFGIRELETRTTSRTFVVGLSRIESYHYLQQMYLVVL